MSYLGLSIKEFSERLSSDDGQHVQEAVWDLVLQNKEKQVYLNIANYLSRDLRNQDLAFRFLNEAFRQCVKDE